MRALLLEQPGPQPRLVAADIPRPKPGARQALVRVAACGFCHHDALIMEGVLRRGVRLPLVPGHEVAGTVEEVGRGVTGLRPGARVVCLLTDACGRCDPCLRGQERLCVKGRGLGHGVAGGMAEYLAVGARNLVEVPESIPWAQACLLACPFGVALRGVERTRIQPGETVLITGAGGGLGTHLVQLARRRGARVLAVTSSEGKSAALEELGADAVLTVGELSFAEVAMALTGDRGVDAALDTVGSALMTHTLRAMAAGGRLTLLGELQRAGAGLNPAEVIFRDLTVIGSAGAERRHVEEAVRLASRGEARPVVAQVLPWRQAMDAYRLMKAREALGRVVLDWTADG